MQNVKFEERLPCTRKGCKQDQPSLILKKVVPHGNKMVGYYECACGAKKKYDHWN